MLEVRLAIGDLEFGKSNAGMGLSPQKSVGEKSVKFSARVDLKEGAESERGGRSERGRARPKLGREKDQVVVSVGGQEGLWQRGEDGLRNGRAGNRAAMVKWWTRAGRVLLSQASGEARSYRHSGPLLVSTWPWMTGDPAPHTSDNALASCFWTGYRPCRVPSIDRCHQAFWCVGVAPVWEWLVAPVASAGTASLSIAILEPLHSFILHAHTYVVIDGIRCIGSFGRGCCFGRFQGGMLPQPSPSWLHQWHLDCP